jgi:hypothetical protein
VVNELFREAKIGRRILKEKSSKKKKRNSFAHKKVNTP